MDSRKKEKEQKKALSQEQLYAPESSALGPYAKEMLETLEEEKEPRQNQDFFALWGNDFPKLNIKNELFLPKYHEEANRRIKNAAETVASADTLKQVGYALLEACAENMMLNALLEKNREKIKKLEERQKKINVKLEAVLSSLKKSGGNY